MSRRARRTAAREPSKRERRSDAGVTPVLDGVARIALIGLVAGTALVVDTGAEAAFDAPKRLVAIVGAATAALAVAVTHAIRSGREPRAGVDSARRPWGLAEAVVALAALALAVGVIAAIVAPHRAAALAGLRVALVLASLAAVGASRAFDRVRTSVGATFLVAAALNATVAVLQGLGVATPFAVETIAGRVDTGALVGNEGHLAQLLALALVAATALVLTVPRPMARRSALALIALYAAGLVATRNVTAVATASAGIALVIVLVFRRRAARPLAVAMLVLAAAVVVTPPLRARVTEASRDARAGAWDAVLTYRLGPWASALEMMRERPMLGFGPGTFGAEFVSHRLAAEIRWRRRFTIPLLTSTFAEAHSDYLQLAAEAGLPAAACATAAVALLVAGVGGAARRYGSALRDAAAAAAREAILLTGVLVTAALMALTWFPMQRPTSAVPILLVAGRGWRLLAGDVVPSALGGAAAAVRRWGPLLLASLLVVAAVPEWDRYRAERELRTVTSATQLLLTDPSRVREPVRALAALDAAASRIAPRLAGDSRAWILAGSTRLVSGDASGALERYGRALALGERAEIVLNMGRAFTLRGDAPRALAAFSRAVWVSPPLLAAVPDERVAEVGAVVDAATARLATGTLDAPPPLP